MLYSDKLEPFTVMLDLEFPGYDKALVRTVLDAAATVARNSNDNDLRSVAGKIRSLFTGEVALGEDGQLVWL